MFGNFAKIGWAAGASNLLMAWQNYTLQRKTFEALYPPALIQNNSPCRHYILSFNKLIFGSAILFILAKSLIVLQYNFPCE